MGRRLNPLGGALLFLTAVSWMAGSASAGPSDPPVFFGAHGQFTLLRPLKPVPGIPVRGLDGKVAGLGQFHGRVVVLNFWATWCRPCVSEMPALDRLASDMKFDHRLAVVAVSIDRGGAAVVRPFVASRHFRNLTVYLDPDQILGSLEAGGPASGSLPLWGLPVTYIIDRRGLVRGYLTGAANWDAPEAGAFLSYFVAEGTEENP